MIRRTIFNLLGLMAVGMLLAVAQAAPVAGQIELAEGDVHIMDAAGVTRIPQVGGEVYVGDTLLSGKDGELHLRMADQAFIALRPASQLKIEIYHAQGGDQDAALLRLLKGTFRSITGLIGQRNRTQYKVQTPNATLGIRGTDHEPLFIAESLGESAPEFAPGTYDKVNSGRTVLENPFGVIEVAPEQIGFAPLRAAPRLAAKPPAQFLRSKHEKRLEERHQQPQGATPHAPEPGKAIREKVRDTLDTPDTTPDKRPRRPRLPPPPPK